MHRSVAGLTLVALALLAAPCGLQPAKAQGVKDLMGKAQSQSDKRAVEDLIRMLKGQQKSVPAAATPPSAPERTPPTVELAPAVPVTPPAAPVEIRPQPTIAAPAEVPAPVETPKRPVEATVEPPRTPPPTVPAEAPPRIEQAAPQQSSPPETEPAPASVIPPTAPVAVTPPTEAPKTAVPATLPPTPPKPPVAATAPAPKERPQAEPIPPRAPAIAAPAPVPTPPVITKPEPPVQRPQQAAPKRPVVVPPPALALPGRPPAIPAVPTDAVDIARQRKLPTVDIEVYFDFDTARISKRAIATLDILGQALSDPRLAAATFLIAGHTDAKGRAEYNQRLSEERAAAVRKYLIEKFGIAETRLVSRGYGESRLKLPKQPNAVQNRRVQIINWTSQLAR